MNSWEDYQAILKADLEKKDIEKAKIETDALRERSGHVRINSKLVGFLYQLMRDHLTPGMMEGLVRDCQEPDITYTNGWLAKYAEDLAKRLESK